MKSSTRQNAVGRMSGAVDPDSYRPAFVQNNYFTEAQIYLIQLDKKFFLERLVT